MGRRVLLAVGRRAGIAPRAAVFGQIRGNECADADFSFDVAFREQSVVYQGDRVARHMEFGRQLAAGRQARTLFQISVHDALT
jgi:hypothetical protein